MGVKRMQRAKLAAAYLLLALAAALGWLYSCLPDRVYLEPGQALYLPRFAWVEPQRGHGSQNVASTRAVGSYQTTLTLGGWLPIKTIRAVVTERPRVTVCGTPFGVKMFSDGALVVAFSDRYTALGSENPAKAAGLRLGDLIVSANGRPVRSNEDLTAAIQAAGGAPLTVVYRRSGARHTATLTPTADENGHYKAGVWVRDSGAGIGTMSFVDPQRGTFAGLGHSISDADTGADLTLLSGEIVPVTIPGCIRAARASCAGSLPPHPPEPCWPTMPPGSTAATPAAAPPRHCPWQICRRSRPARPSCGPLCWARRRSPIRFRSSV